MMPDYIVEAERIAELTGNVGRKVTRHLEQLFPYGLFAQDFTCPVANTLVDKALFMVRMQRAQQMAKDRTIPDEFSICVQSTEEPGTVRVVVIPLKTPESMRAKQDQLQQFAAAMRCFIAMAVMTDEECLVRMRQCDFEIEHAEDANNPNYAYLAELVKGDYTHINQTGGNFLTLASALNPSVSDELLKALREDCVAA